MAWTREAVAYQVFVDRFAPGSPGRREASASPSASDAGDRCPGGSAPGQASFAGGTLRGIESRLDYLEDLGVNLLCLTPVFLSSSNHRYNTYDYYRIDPRAGTHEDFRALVSQAHRRGIRILLDGVFNHCGRGFFPFFDVMENGLESRWRHWFHIDGFPVDAYGTHRFRAWQDAPALPEFNLENREARDYLLRVAAFWTGEGIDGWRLDAVRHVRHVEFWGELRRAVKRVNREAYLLAEIWEDPGALLSAGHFDGATHYALREAILQFAVERSVGPSAFARRLEALAGRQGWETTLGMWNLLGSHDTPRIWTLARGDVRRVTLAFLLQFCYPGIPAIYYGDENGLPGGDEPRNRRVMEWDADAWQTEIRDVARLLVRLRRTRASLQAGDWQTLVADDSRGVCAFLRRSGADLAVVVGHAGRRDERLSITVPGLDGSRRFVDQLTGRPCEARHGVLDIGVLRAGTGALLLPQP